MELSLLHKSLEIIVGCERSARELRSQKTTCLLGKQEQYNIVPAYYDIFFPPSNLGSCDSPESNPHVGTVLNAQYEVSDFKEQVLAATWSIALYVRIKTAIKAPQGSALIGFNCSHREAAMELQPLCPCTASGGTAHRNLLDRRTALGSQSRYM